MGNGGHWGRKAWRSGSFAASGDDAVPRREDSEAEVSRGHAAAASADYGNDRITAKLAHTACPLATMRDRKPFS